MPCPYFVLGAASEIAWLPPFFTRTHFYRALLAAYPF